MHARRQTDRSGAAKSWRRFRECFPDRERVFLPVVYTSNEKQAFLTLETAQEAGADGVFLTSHGLGHPVLLEITRKVIADYPKFFVAVNCLDLNALEVIDRLPAGVGGVWVNEPPTLEGIQNVVAAAREGRPATGWDGLLFAVVATTATAEKPTVADDMVAPAGEVDVPTIIASGGERGANIDVCKDLRRAFPKRPLAIAGDMRAVNLDRLLPYVNCVMTAACSGRDLEHMDLGVAKRLAATIHAGEKSAGVVTPP